MRTLSIIILSVFVFNFILNAEPIGGIQKANAPAFRMSATDTLYSPASEKETVLWGDSLKTGSGGFLGLIFFDDGSLVKLSGNTAIKLALPEESVKRTIELSLGDLWAKIIRADIATEIKTPSSTASVRGTKFWIFVSPSGDTRLVCQEGLIDFVNNVSGDRIFVSTGQMCAAGMDGSLESSSIDPDLEELPEPQPAPEPEEPQDEKMTPQGGPSGTSTPSPPSAASGGGLGISFNGAVGAASINGEIYQYFSLRPDISLGKFGVGLDLSLYFDSDGKVRQEDWDEPEDIIDKIYYLRYGKPGDSFYLRAGSLSPITLGYGLIMRRYTNAIEWPQVRRIGLQTKIRYGQVGFEGLINNFRELETPGLVGGRLTYEVNQFALPMVLGGTMVYDGNQYLGAKDEDGDGVPDNWDLFPGIDDKDHIDWLNTLDPATIQALIESGDLPNINNPPPNIADLREEVIEWGLDIGIPLIRTKALQLWTYAQMAQIVDYGRGYTFPGFSLDMGPFHAGVEYRIFEKQFTGEFFDMSYEVERVVWNEASNDYVTKQQIVAAYPKAQGYYAEAGVNLFNLLDLFAAYQDMTYDGSDNLNSIYGSASLSTSFIPKISLAEAYYYQPNFDKSFSVEADGTVIGYKIGVGVGGGLSIIYDQKSIYYNGEPNRIMTIETAITF